MKHREFGSTGIQAEHRRIGRVPRTLLGEKIRSSAISGEASNLHLRAVASAINLFDTGYGDEVDIPEELKGHTKHCYFSLKVGLPQQQSWRESSISIS